MDKKISELRNGPRLLAIANQDGIKDDGKFSGWEEWYGRLADEHDKPKTQLAEAVRLLERIEDHSGDCRSLSGFFSVSCNCGFEEADAFLKKLKDKP